MATRNFGSDIFDPAGSPPTPIVMDDLGDADTTTTPPAVNDVLTWDGANWVPQVAGGAALNFFNANLSSTGDRVHDQAGDDVTVNNAATLAWNGTNQLQFLSIGGGNEGYMAVDGTVEFATVGVRETGGGGLDAFFRADPNGTENRFIDNTGTRTAGVLVQSGPVTAAGDPQLFLETSGVFQTVSQVGQYLRLGALTGEVEFATIDPDVDVIEEVADKAALNTYLGTLSLPNERGRLIWQQDINMLYVYNGFQDPVISNAWWFTNNANHVAALGLMDILDTGRLSYRADTSEFFVYDGGLGSWTKINRTIIDELDDVDTTTTPPAVGNVLAWDGTNWVPAAAGGADTNFVSTDLTQTAARAHDLGGFGQTWTNAGPFSVTGPGTHSLTSATLASTARLTLQSSGGNVVELRSSDGAVERGEIRGDGASMRLFSSNAGGNEAGFLSAVGLVAGVNQTHVQTAGVDAGSATLGDVLTLVDAVTGEVEFTVSAAAGIDYTSIGGIGGLGFDAAVSQNVAVHPSGASNMLPPANLTDGQVIHLYLRNSTGSNHTLTFDPIWTVEDGSATFGPVGLTVGHSPFYVQGVYDSAANQIRTRFEAGPGIGDTNLLSSDLTQAANRVQDFASFAQQWDNMGPWQVESTNGSPIELASTAGAGFQRARLNIPDNQSAAIQHFDSATSLFATHRVTAARAFSSFTNGAGQEARMELLEGVVAGSPTVHLRTAEVDAATAVTGDVLTLSSGVTGEAAWVDRNDLSSILTGDFTQTAARVQDFGGFTQTWNQVGDLVINTDPTDSVVVNANSVTAAATELRVEEALSFLRHVDAAGVINGILVDPTFTQIRYDDTLGDLYAIGVNAAGPSVGMSAQKTAGTGVVSLAFIDNGGADPDLLVRTPTVIAATAVPGDVLTLSLVTGESEWATPAADIHFMNTDLTQVVNRVHNAAGFRQTWNQVGSFFVNLDTADVMQVVSPGLGTETATLLVDQARSELTFNDGAGAVKQVIVEPAGARFESTPNGGIDLFQMGTDITGPSAGVSAQLGGGAGIHSLAFVDNGGADPDLQIRPTSVVAATATVGQVLTLQAASGTSEWQDLPGSTILDVDATQTANRTHDFAGFQQNWNNVGDWAVAGVANGDFTFSTDGPGAVVDQLLISSSVTSSHFRRDDGSGNTSQLLIGTDRASLDYSNALADTASVGTTLNWSGIEALNSGGAGTHRLLFDRTGVDPTLRVVTTEVLSALRAVGDVLTLQNAATGEAEWGSVLPANFELFQSLPVSTTLLTAMQSKVAGTTALLPIGTYKVTVSYVWNHDANTDDFEAEFLWDGVALTSYGSALMHKAEPKDSAGNTSATGSAQAYPVTMVYYVPTVGVSTHTIGLNYRTDNGANESSIWDASVAVERVS